MYNSVINGNRARKQNANICNTKSVDVDREIYQYIKQISASPRLCLSESSVDPANGALLNDFCVIFNWGEDILIFKGVMPEIAPYAKTE